MRAGGHEGGMPRKELPLNPAYIAYTETNIIHITNSYPLPFIMYNGLIATMAAITYFYALKGIKIPDAPFFCKKYSFRNCS